MVDASLRCEETFSSPAINSPVERRAYQELLPQFCHAYQDRALVEDSRIIVNMLQLEEHYVPSKNFYTSQGEIKLHMRKIVAEWMLDVCVDQRCHVDVFLLAVNIMDRFLSTIRLKKNQFQLLGAAAIFLASKLVECSPISALTLVRYTADTYDREELLSMELLILSKLKWDLTAITAYDYLDHLLDAVTKRTEADDCTSRQLKSLRRQTERLVTLCATDPHFLSLPPSMVASASLASAVQLDFESQPTANLNHIFEKLRTVARIEMDCLRQCIEQIEELFISDAAAPSTSLHQDPPATPPPPPSTSGDPRSSPSEGFFSSPDQRSAETAEKGRESDNATPTEVFNVSAYCVT